MTTNNKPLISKEQEYATKRLLEMNRHLSGKKTPTSYQPNQHRPFWFDLTDKRKPLTPKEEEEPTNIMPIPNFDEMEEEEEEEKKRGFKRPKYQSDDNWYRRRKPTKEPVPEKAPEFAYEPNQVPVFGQQPVRSPLWQPEQPGSEVPEPSWQPQPGYAPQIVPELVPQMNSQQLADAMVHQSMQEAAQKINEMPIMMPGPLGAEAATEQAIAKMLPSLRGLGQKIPNLMPEYAPRMSMPAVLPGKLAPNNLMTEGTAAAADLSNKILNGAAAQMTAARGFAEIQAANAAAKLTTIGETLPAQVSSTVSGVFSTIGGFFSGLFSSLLSILATMQTTIVVAAITLTAIYGILNATNIINAAKTIGQFSLQEVQGIIFMVVPMTPNITNPSGLPSA